MKTPFFVALRLPFYQVLIFAVFFLDLTPVFAQNSEQRISEAIDQPFIKSHIGFLASDELKGRDTGSPELKIAAKYITSRFVEYGVDQVSGMDSYLQTLALEESKSITEGSVIINEKPFSLTQDFIKIKGEAGAVSGKVVYADYGALKDLQKAKVKGKIVVALCGDGESQSPQQWLRMSEEKRKNVLDLGGVALVELYGSPQVPWKSLVGFLTRSQTSLASESAENASTELTHVWMNRTAVDLKSVEKKSTASIELGMSNNRRFTSDNIVGYVQGTDPELSKEFIVYSAHYDHIGIGSPDAKGDSIYNGARDNAVGTVTVLAAAKYLAKNPTKRSALFVLFTGEEKGLLGSRYFVENAPIPLEDMVFCFNSDNGGYNDTSLASIIGLTRTSAESMIVEACKAFGLQAIEDPAKEQGLFDRSDNVNFAAKGIPAPTFSMGFTAFDEEIRKYYHQAGDEPETLDYVYLEKFFRAYVLSCELIGNEAARPVWNEGDKYYEAGLKLYGK